MEYRGYTITTERRDGDRIIWVETPEGPFDAGSVARAKQYVDALIEEIADLAQPAPMSGNQ